MSDPSYCLAGSASSVQLSRDLVCGLLAHGGWFCLLTKAIPVALDTA